MSKKPRLSRDDALNILYAFYFNTDVDTLSEAYPVRPRVRELIDTIHRTNRQTSKCGRYYAFVLEDDVRYYNRCYTSVAIFDAEDKALVEHFRSVSDVANTNYTLANKTRAILRFNGHVSSYLGSQYSSDDIKTVSATVSINFDFEESK